MKVGLCRCSSQCELERNYAMRQRTTYNRLGGKIMFDKRVIEQHANECQRNCPPIPVRTHLYFQLEDLLRKTIQSGEWHTLVKVVVVNFRVVGRSTSRTQRNERELRFEVYSDNNCRVERCSKHRGIGVELFEDFARRRNPGTRINKARQILTTISSPQLDSLTAGENKSR